MHGSQATSDLSLSFSTDAEVSEPCFLPAVVDALIQVDFPAGAPLSQTVVCVVQSHEAQREQDDHQDAADEEGTDSGLQEEEEAWQRESFQSHT